MIEKDSEGRRTFVGWLSKAGITLVLLGITVLLGVDLATDRALHSTRPGHLVTEAIAALAALGAAATTLQALRTKHETVEQLSRDLAFSREESLKWEQEAAELVRGLSHAIDHQFDRWGLTTAEGEIALLLLKGLSTKEIGELRSTREATVRQQAQGVYRKAGLLGRAELAAFFLEDLLAPATPADRQDG